MYPPIALILRTTKESKLNSQLAISYMNSIFRFKFSRPVYLKWILYLMKFNHQILRIQQLKNIALTLYTNIFKFCDSYGYDFSTFGFMECN